MQDDIADPALRRRHPDRRQHRLARSRRGQAAARPHRGDQSRWPRGHDARPRPQHRPWHRHHPPGRQAGRQRRATELGSADRRVAKVVLPRFKAARRPFVIVFWSRDPDGTQHAQGDSLNTLRPGINGPTSLAGIRNASNDLQRLREALRTLGPRPGPPTSSSPPTTASPPPRRQSATQRAGQAQLSRHRRRASCRRVSWPSISPRP